jgi:uncharacterized iron-regulated membrane protein
MVIWTILGGLAAAVVALTGFAIWRQRRRTSAGDRAVSDRALRAAERRNAERQGIQGATTQREQMP